MKSIQEFTNLYSKSITLRFEAIPVGNTVNNLHKILEVDKKLDEDYQIAKQIIDNYHRYHIETTLSNFNLEEDKLHEFFNLYTSKDSNGRDKKLSALQSEFRKKLSTELLTNEKQLLGKELITQLIPQWLETTGNTEAQSIISKFNKFTTYFKGFNTNRENIYVKEEKKNSITYRLIHENLPKFIDNIKIFNRISQTAIAENFDTIAKELKLNTSIDNIFTITYYNQLLTQSGIERFNLIIGGYSTNSKTKYKGINEYINEYNQTHPDNQLPKFRPLFKQILSEKESFSHRDILFNNSSDVICAIKQSYQSIHSLVIPKIGKVLSHINQASLSHIYIENSADLTKISQELCESYDYIKRYFINEYNQIRPQKPKESTEKYIEKINNEWKKKTFVTLEYINNILCKENKEDIITYFTGQRLSALIDNINDAYSRCNNIFETEYNDELKNDKESTSLIKDLLDSIKGLQLFLKPLSKGEFQPDKDDIFYNEFIPLYSILDNNISHLYNRVRNYVTQKPYSTDKVKLNFDNSTFLNGWDVNKEKDNTAIILRKDGFYYLGVMDKKHNKCFYNLSIPSNGECYEKMEYKVIPMTTGVGGFIRKCFGTAKDCGWVCPQNCLNKNGKIIIIDDEAKENLKEIIDCQKDFFDKYEKDGFKYRNYNFSFKPSDEYKNLSDFYRDVEQQGYKVTFRNISESYINTLVEEGKLYLFRLHNKDFSPHSKGLPNLHTLYWKMLFDKDNLTNVMYALNGHAELFYRPASIKPKITHPANEPIPCKSIENKGEKRTFEYDLIKDKRYTQDKYQFHVPITLNFKNRGINNLIEFNQYINQHYLPQATHIIGIDRGERHLLYISVIDMNGKIVEQFSLNDIVNEYNGKQFSTNYHKKLEEREKERAKARESWKSIENIKELKEGYMSQVVHKIVQLVLKYNAIIVLEDLNKAFKNNRLKVGKSVYQKFEDMLINKLSYIVDKTKDKSEPCGLFNALQLACIPENKSHRMNQCGIIFYIPAWCTSKIDPATGFVNKIDTQYTNIEKAKELFQKFTEICYNKKENYFEFHIDDYTKLGGIENTRKNWILTSQGMRIESTIDINTRKYSNQKEINLTEEFMAILGNGIESNLKEYIAQQNSPQFFKSLLRCLRLMLQMRNSITGTEIDYLISPIKQIDGSFYNSNNEKAKGKSDDGRWLSSLPVDADANGAYNIARKGLIAANKLKDGLEPKEAFAISNQIWLNFAQQNNE